VLLVLGAQELLLLNTSGPVLVVCISLVEAPSMLFQPLLQQLIMWLLVAVVVVLDLLVVGSLVWVPAAVAVLVVLEPVQHFL
jgi:hypothetical protein